MDTSTTTSGTNTGTGTGLTPGGNAFGSTAATNELLSSASAQSGVAAPSFDATTGAQTSTPPPVNQTQNASAINSQMSGNTTGAVFPPAPTNPTAGTSSNTSIPNPIPSVQDITSQANQQTPGEQINSTLLQKVASLIGGNKGQTQLTNDAESSAGIPALQKTVNDLNTQLEGLNNQATDLQNQASPGGAIQNQEQQNATGRGITAAGLQPLTAGDLRTNQIKQSAIASQALTLKSLIYGAQGNLTLAKDSADKAATAQYEQQQQAIDYQKALIDANTPQMNKEEKNQALVVQSQLQDRQNQIDQAKADKQTIIAAAVATMQAYPNSSAAHYAAQQALSESNQQQPDLSKALGLLSKYPSLATQQAQASLQNTRLDIAQKVAASSGVGGGYNGTTATTQNSLEQQYRTVLEKQFSARSGSLGIQSAKVDAANHLRALLDQYKQPDGTYAVPPAQYAELAQGMASLVSGSNTISDSRTKDIQSASAQGDLAKALQYASGQTFTGSSQAILKNLSDSVDRQGQVSQQLRAGYVKSLQGLMPTQLDPARAKALIDQSLPSYGETVSDPVEKMKLQLNSGEILVSREEKDGRHYEAITPSELRATDQKL